MTSDKGWRIDLNRVSQELGQGIQHSRQLLRMAAAVVDLARRVDEGTTNALKEVEDARERGAIGSPDPSLRGFLGSDRDSLLPPTTTECEALAEDARRLIETFGNVNSSKELHYWFQNIILADPPRRGRNYMPMSEPSVRMSGAFFAPLNGNHPKENGEALTLRVVTSYPAGLAEYWNLGTLIVLALVGARVVRVMTEHPKPDEQDEDEDSMIYDEYAR